jgi:hypothetical protein
MAKGKSGRPKGKKEPAIIPQQIEPETAAGDQFYCEGIFDRSLDNFVAKGQVTLAMKKNICKEYLRVFFPESENILPSEKRLDRNLQVLL